MDIQSLSLSLMSRILLYFDGMGDACCSTCVRFDTVHVDVFSLWLRLLFKLKVMFPLKEHMENKPGVIEAVRFCVE